MVFGLGFLPPGSGLSLRHVGLSQFWLPPGFRRLSSG